MSPRSRAARWLLGACMALIAAVGLGRLFFFGVYRVEKRSMEPTIHGAPEGGDVVLVWHGRGTVPRRFQLVVVQAGEGEDPIVKRAVGLPGEKLELRLGDVLIDDRLLPLTSPRPAPVPLFDSRLQEVEEWFDYLREREVWTRAGRTWRLDSRGVEPDSNLERMVFTRRALDGWVDEAGRVEDGLAAVNDLVLDLEVRLGDPPARLRLGLLEMGDAFDVELEPLSETRWRARLVNRFLSASGSGEVVLEEAEVELVAGRWHSLSLANVDDQVAFAVDGRTALLHDYPGNHFHPQDTLARGLSLGARAWFGGPGGLASFRRIRLSRDLYYTRRGELGSAAPVQLGPEQIFVLGDNSAESRDSRDFGPVPLSRVLGRPAWVLWPPARIRRLPGPQPLFGPPPW